MFAILDGDLLIGAGQGKEDPSQRSHFPIGSDPCKTTSAEDGLLRWCLVLLQGTSGHSSRPCAHQRLVGCSDAVLLETSSPEDHCKGTFSAEGDNKKGS